MPQLILKDQDGDLAVFPSYVESQQTEYILRRGTFGYTFYTTQKQLVLQTQSTGFGHRYREFKDAQYNILFELHRDHRWRQNAFSGWNTKQEKLFTIDGTYKGRFKDYIVEHGFPNIMASSCWCFQTGIG